MAFEMPITVKQAVDNIHSKKYLLPAIQRELVWDTLQIERLFDSLMRDYPVGSFLFWYVDKRKSHDYQFYEFIKDYHQKKNKHNQKAEVSGEDDIIAILDGQQRLTSLFIGLRGSYAYKEHMKRWDNDAAFPARKLYLNLLKKYSDEEEIDLEYHFEFLTDKEAADQRDDDHLWFKVGDIQKFTEPYEVNNYLISSGVMALGEKGIFANKTLFKLYSVIQEKPVVNFFLEKGEELDKVLNIFVRVNSGGTPLSHSDLLLSIASASWRERDAREEIHSFVDEINNVGDGFNFSKDFVLKTCLVLCDFPDIAFKVDNFNNANMRTIEQKWESITEAIRLTVNLIAAFGYNRDTLVSNNALIPIAYYLHKIGSPHNFVQASRFEDDRQKIKKWLVVSLLKRAFGGTPDNVIRPIQRVVSAQHDSFPLDGIIEEFRGKTKSLIFNADEIQNLFEYYYGSPYTFSTLAVLYPTLDFRNKFHLDHIHPKNSFKRKNLVKLSLSEDKIEFFMTEMDYLANLQLLEGIPNMEKSDRDFKTWLYEKHPNEITRRDYMEKHYIPDIDLSLENFEEFIAERTKLMTDKFIEILKLDKST